MDFGSGSKYSGLKLGSETLLYYFKIQFNLLHMRYFVMTTLLLLSVVVQAQRQHKNVSLAFTNHNTAKPFSKFSSLFSGVFHPGIRVSYGFNWQTKPKHDWVQQFHAGYFFHRFVQHAIPIYTDFGYRYKFSKSFYTTASVGAGYMHSVPATAVLEMDEEGEYSNAKGIGRAQAIATFTLEARYNFKSTAPRPFSIFFNYQQQLQAPFINSYVPLLPYNSVAIGVSLPLKTKPAL